MPWGIVAAAACGIVASAAAMPIVVRHAGRLRTSCRHCGAALRDGMTECEYCRSVDVWLVPPWDETIYPDSQQLNPQWLARAGEADIEAVLAMRPGGIVRVKGPESLRRYSSPVPSPAYEAPPPTYCPAPPVYDSPAPSPSYSSGGGGDFGGGGASGDY